MTTIADGSYLGRMLALIEGKSTMDALEEGATRLEAAVLRLGPAGLAKRRAPGAWTGAQVLAHLADSELAIGFRARQVLTDEAHVMQEYDESAWAGLHGEIDVDAALEAFLAARRWNLKLFRGLDKAQLERVARHPKRGDEALDTTLRALAGHTFNHLAQIEAV
jgi:hypothetical protein